MISENYLCNLTIQKKKKTEKRQMVDTTLLNIYIFKERGWERKTERKPETNETYERNEVVNGICLGVLVATYLLLGLR